MPPNRPARRPSIPNATFSSFSRFTKARLRKRKSSSERRRKSSGEKAVDLKKKRKGESLQNGMDGADDVVFADFEFFDPKPSDFHGVKILLQSYLDAKQWDLSGFVDLILGQPTVGTVVKVNGDDDDNLFAVITALNMKRYQDHKCMMELKEFLLQICDKAEMESSLRQLLDEYSGYTGLLVSQRMINLPVELLPPLHDALFDEISWATEDEPTQELRDSFDFRYYLIITKIYMKKNGSESSAKIKNHNEEPVIYIKLEDEIFHKLCSWSFTFPTQQVVPPEGNTDLAAVLSIHQRVVVDARKHHFVTSYIIQQSPNDLHCFQNEICSAKLRNYASSGLVMMVESDKVPVFRDKLKSLVNAA